VPRCTNAAPASASATNANEVADLDISELADVRVSPFDVSLQLDKGYRAANSVSASRFDAPIMDLPFAIQAFTHDFIADQKPVNIYDVVKYSPGVTYRANDFNEGNANVAIRGFAVGTTPGSVQILRDGFHGPSIFEFTDIERVEVVKGPSSFLYGQVAPGGIVNIITKTPKPEFAASASITYGSYDSYRIEGDITGPVTNGIFYRLAGSYNQDINYWAPYDAHSWDFAPSVLWRPSDNVSLTVKYEQYDKNESPQVMQKPGYSTQSGVVPTPADPNLSAVDVPGLPDNWNSMACTDYRYSTTWSLEALLDVRAGEHWNLRASYAIEDYEIDSAFSGNIGMNNAYPFAQGRRFRRQNYANTDQTFGFQGAGEYEYRNVSVRLLAGAEFNLRTFDNMAGQATNDPSLNPVDNPIGSPLPNWNLMDPRTWNRIVNIPLWNLTSTPRSQSTDYQDKAVYAGTTLGFFDDSLLVLAGGRLTHTESQLTDHLAGTIKPKLTDDKFTPQLGALYKLRPGLALFATYAESFVPGTTLLNNLDGSQTPARPTTGKGYDIGLKYDLFDVVL
jgi:iron complex outermembrane receptor protein